MMGKEDGRIRMERRRLAAVGIGDGEWTTLFRSVGRVRVGLEGMNPEKSLAGGVGVPLKGVSWHNGYSSWGQAGLGRIWQRD